MSCDNIPGNGDVAQRMITAFARLKDAELGRLDRARGAVPELDGRPDHARHHRRRQEPSGRGVRRPRTAGPWSASRSPSGRWRTRFSDDRPPFEDVGVQLVPDVEPYELMKLRLLNASHQALCYLGYLAGYRYAHEVCQDELFTSFLLGYMDREATPDAGAGARRGPRRLQAPADRAVRQPRGARHPGPAVRRELRPDPEVAGAGRPRAAWPPAATSGTPPSSSPPGPATPRAWTSRASRSRSSTGCATRWWSGRAARARSPLVFVSDRDLFGDLVDDERFVTAYRWALDSLHSKGARATLEAARSSGAGRMSAPPTEPAAMRVAVLRVRR